MTDKSNMRVIPHPIKLGFWTIAVSNGTNTAIYGTYERRELAIAVMLTN